MFLIECMESLLCKVLLLWKHVFLLTVTKMKSYLVCITLLFHKFSENCRGSSRQSISLQPFAFLQQKTEEEGLGGLRIFSLEKRRLGEISSISIENRREDAKRTKPGSALFIGAQGQNKTQWSKSGTQKAPSEHQDALLYCTLGSTLTGCQRSCRVLEIFKSRLDVVLGNLP